MLILSLSKVSQYSAILTSCLGNNPNLKMPPCKQYLASFFACLTGITCCVPQEKVFFLPCNQSLIGQSCAVKTAGYWHHSFFPRLQNWTLFRSINTQKALGQYPVAPNHAWSIAHMSCKIERIVEFTKVCIVFHGIFVPHSDVPKEPSAPLS